MKNGNDQGMKVLFTSPVLEYPAAGGPPLRIANSIKALNALSELHILARLKQKKLGGPQAEDHYKKYCHRFNYTPAFRDSLIRKMSNYRFKNKGVLTPVLNLPFQIFGGIFKNFVKPHSLQTEVEYISNYVIRNNIRLIWFGFGNISYDLMKALKSRLPGVKMVCDTDSVWSRFVLRELETLKDNSRRNEIEERGRKKEQEEREWTDFMDVTTGVSEVDMEYYKSIAKDPGKVKLFSNVLDLADYKVKPPKAEGFKNPCMFLAGTFSRNSPMEFAARWVIRDILPQVKNAIADIRFYIIGVESDTVLSDISDPAITITGKLDSVLPYLCYSDVALVPLKFESGTRFKILEAGACGIPIVSTTLGAEGIPVKNRHDILIADDPEGFANAIIEVIKDKRLATNLAHNCNELIRSKYSVQSHIEEARDIIRYLNIPAK